MPYKITGYCFDSPIYSDIIIDRVEYNGEDGEHLEILYDRFDNIDDVVNCIIKNGSE